MIYAIFWGAQRMIIVKSDNKTERMMRTGKVVAMTLAVVEEVIKPGVATRYVNDAAEKFLLQQNVIPAFGGL